MLKITESTGFAIKPQKTKARIGGNNMVDNSEIIN